MTLFIIKLNKITNCLFQNVAMSNVSENLKMDAMKINQHDNITIN